MPSLISHPGTRHHHGIARLVSVRCEFRGAELDDPDGILAGTGKYMRHVKLKVDGDTDTRALTEMIKLAYADMQERLRNCGAKKTPAS